MKSYCNKNIVCAEGYLYKLYVHNDDDDYFLDVIRFSYYDFFWCGK